MSSASTPPLPLLDVVGLTREPFLRDVRLSLQAGEITVLSGRSGSGKSVLLRALADLDPTRGSVRLDGEERSDMPAAAWRSQVLLVAQGGPTLPGTVGNDLDRIAGLARQQEHATTLTRAAELAGLSRDAETAHLSGGEAAGLGLARALATSPRVLLLDEPTAAMDPERAADVERRVADWVRQPGPARTVLWISHDPTLAERLGARALDIDDLGATD